MWYIIGINFCDGRVDVNIESNLRYIIFRISGRLDATSSPVLERKLLGKIDKGKINVVLDLSQVNYLSSAGMRLILSITKKLKVLSGNLHCCSVNDEVMEIIKMAGFERVIHIFPTEQEAVQNFK